MKINNYLPHPINHYGPYQSQPEDHPLLLQARKDQAAWNLEFLINGPELERWYLAPAFTKELKAESVFLGWSLASNYRMARLQIEGKPLMAHMQTLAAPELALLVQTHDLWTQAHLYGVDETNDEDKESARWWIERAQTGVARTLQKLEGKAS